MNIKSIIITTAIALSLSLSLIAQTNNEEFRATWVITWEHISGSSSVETNQARVRQILDNHKAANMNAVLFQVRQSGTAYYNSSFEPWGSYAGGSDPGYDPLAYAVQEAHKRGMEVHAWFNVFQTSSTAAGTPAAEHPEWVCRDKDGIPMSESRCLSPGLKAVRDYTVQVAMEIVRNYDIDGLHLDYIRWNEYSNSKSSKSFAKQAEQENWLDGMITDEQIDDLSKNKAGRYLYDVEHPYSDIAPTGYSSWEEYWRGSVTTLVHTLHDSIQAVKPWVRLSVAALGKYNWSGWQGYGSVYQDAALWFNQGYIDQLTPMSYHWTTGSGFYGMLVGDGTQSWGYYIQPGINAGRLFSAGPGSYILEEQKIWDRHVEIVNSCRTVNWLDGFQFFSYGSWNDYQYWGKAANLFFKRKTKIRANGLIDCTPPSAPQISLQKVDSLHYRVIVTPPAKGENLWYAVYRSNENSIDVNNDEIIAVQFGQDDFTVNDEFNGTQDFDGQYHYAVTAFDRFWNESQLSTTSTGDSLPSFAPVVINYTPANGTTVPTSNYITLTFSKTIDITTLENAIEFAPTVTLGQIIWSSDHKTVTLKPAQPLIFDTHYTVTLNPQVSDINGRQLDGNGDGQSGDAFSFQFNTQAVDLSGPVVEDSFPVESTTDFDTDDCLTIVFDEVVSPTSIGTGSILFENNNKDLTIEPVLTKTGNRSILSVRSYAKLLSDADNSLIIKNSLTDTLSNPMSADYEVHFHTANSYYTERSMIDDFMGTGDWKAVDFSGSTAGIVALESAFGYSTTCFVPGTTHESAKKKSAFIKYKWDVTASTHLLREHINASTPTTINIDTSYTVQCYLFGDGSQNLFNFSLYEYNADGSKTLDIIEVGPWRTIDWLGWKLVEWDLGDPAQVGDFISAGRNMNGHHYGLDGFLLRKGENGAISGQVFIDELRMIKRATGQAPANNAPALAALPDTSVTSGDQIRIYPTYTDPDPQDGHQIMCLSDTSGVFFKIMGHTSGSIVFVKTVAGYIGTALVTVIVKDFGIGELADTVQFHYVVKPGAGIVDDLLPRQIELSQNFPNPFNPVTIIKFNLPQPARVELRIYNLLGEQVTELVNGRIEAGEHSVLFNGADLPSGQYFYQMITDKQTLTRKMVLIK